MERPQSYVFHRTIHQGIGLINQICHVVHDGEENYFLILLACLSRTAYQEKRLRFALLSSMH